MGLDYSVHRGHLNVQGISKPKYGAEITIVPPITANAAAIPIKKTTVTGITRTDTFIARSFSLRRHSRIEETKLRISQPHPIAKNGYKSSNGSSAFRHMPFAPSSRMANMTNPFSIVSTTIFAGVASREKNSSGFGEVP